MRATSLRRVDLEKPLAVIEGFFGTYTPENARELLWDLVSRSLCCSDEELGKFGRREILAGYEELERLIEAAYLVILGHE